MKGELLYEGKAKKVFVVEGDEKSLVLSYKNDATAFNGKKKASFIGKGKYNNLITAKIFDYLHSKGIATHFQKSLNETEQLVTKTAIIPVEVVVRNVAAGSITKRLGMKEKTVFSPALVELFYKDDDLGDPLINDEHARILANVDPFELEQMKEAARAINEHLLAFFETVNLQLADFKLEFGKDVEGNLLLADEISPDTCRLWDMETGEKMDKDVFREDIGDLIETYDAILQRLEAVK
ncbi:phosphoribosylaminoimidazolesuccinocarboxamide synthase [Radiobacillus kanasensis]|uniref:phosphoribosylaminoimidazolesuccinocarboxamide synthase n=1 Tax=Radiobacillus kanasensis TaxID=2844358 RepID=UPI001E41BC72|nr:phosphoribosylaminoimidazolesuccinocarboxamide synthase [Radiobacillus kanasensis]UFT99908.1 phosphoribosylaminoimidazolesuccinocarboxamide synthase [Radiobacillus kanasensis]